MLAYGPHKLGVTRPDGEPIRCGSYSGNSEVRVQPTLSAEGNSEMLMNRSNLNIFEIGFRRMSKTLECISICPFAFMASKLITKLPSVSKSNIIVPGV